MVLALLHVTSNILTSGPNKTQASLNLIGGILLFCFNFPSPPFFDPSEAGIVTFGQSEAI